MRPNKLLNPLTQIIGAGIELLSLLSGLLLYDRLRLRDLVIDGALVYLIFFQRIDRNGS